MAKKAPSKAKALTLQTIFTVIVKSNRAIDLNFVAINDKIKSLDKKIDKLIASSNSEFGKVGHELKEIKTEVLKIQKVSGYSDMYSNLKLVEK